MGTVEERIVIDFGQAVGALRSVAGEARAAGAAVNETQRAATAAMASLNDVAAAMRASMSTASAQMAASVSGVQRNAVAEAMRAQLALSVQGQDRTTESIRRMTEATAANNAVGEKAAAMTGAVRAGYVNLGHQIADVFAQMAVGVNPFTIAVQQGPQAAAALAGMGGAAAAAAGGLAALTGAVVAGYGAWRIYNADTRIAERVAADLSAAHAELQPLLDSTRRATIDLAEATGQLSPLMADLERNSLRALTAWGNATDETRAKLAALKREQQSVTTQVIDAGQAFYDAIDPTGLLSEGYQRLWGGSRELQTEIDALTGAVDQSIVALRENRTTTEGTLVAEEAAKKAKEAHTAAARAQKDAVDALKKAQDELWNSLKRENDERRAALAIAQAQAAVDFSRGTISEDQYQRILTGSRMGEIQALQPNIVNDREAQIEAMTKLATTISLQDAATRENTVAVQSATDQRLAAATSAVGAFNSGPSGFMSAMGPWGAFIAGLINMVSNLDETLEQFESWHERAMEGIANLPVVFADKLPDMVERGTEAAFAMFPKLLTNIIENSGLWESGGGKLAEAFIKGILNAGKSMFTGGDSKVSGGDVANFLLGGIPNLVKGQHDTGAVSIGRPGLYMLHGGERVLTSGQATSARNRTSGGSVTIQIGSVMGGRAGVRELVDLIRRESGPLGSRVSLGV